MPYSIGMLQIWSQILKYVKRLVFPEQAVQSFGLRRHVCGGIYIVVLTVALLPNVGAAQRLFHWPSDVPDGATYKTVDECKSFAARVERSERVNSVRRDTFPNGREVSDTIDSLHPNTIIAAQRCSAKFSIDRVIDDSKMQVGDMESFLNLLFKANRDDDASRFITRWMASVEASDDTLAMVVPAKAIQSALQAHPVRFPLVWKLLDAINIETFWNQRIYLLGQTLQQAERVTDSINTRKAAESLLAVSAQLHDSIKRLEEWQRKGGAGSVVMRGYLALNKKALQDSLRVSSNAYRGVLERGREAAGLDERHKIDVKYAMPLEGDYWFPGPPSTPRPTSGKVALVVMVANNACDSRCLGEITMLRRIMTRFPAVEVTLVARTLGYIGLIREPRAPEQEALFIDSLYRIRHALPIPLVVTNTKFWRLPAPDDRRINESVANAINYGSERSPAENGIFLVDRHGEIVCMVAWVPQAEKQLGEYIESVLQQPER